MLLEEFKKDLIDAMKAQDKITLNTLRSVKGALQLEVINKKLEESDELLLDVINKQIKMRNDSISEFKKGNREDLIESYQKEINILNKYMPKMLNEEELDSIIDETIKEVNATTMKDFGMIMKVITPRVKNRCDMSKLSLIIKNKFN